MPRKKTYGDLVKEFGAEVAREAARLARKEGRTEVTDEDIEKAIKIVMAKEPIGGFED